MTLDINPASALVLATVMILLNGAVLGFVHRDLPAQIQPSARAWRLSSLIVAAGCILMAAHGFASVTYLNPLAYGLAMIGLTGYLYALRLFYRLPAPWWMWLPASLCIVGVIVFTSLIPSLAWRTAIISSTWGWLLLTSFWTLHAQGSSDRAISRRVLEVIYLFCALFVAARGLWFFLSPSPPQTIVDPGHLINLATPIFAATLPVIGTTAFLLMCSERLRRQWEHAASTDNLTGLANRRVLAEVGGQALRNARDRGQTMTLALIDADHFKHVNDSHGHEVGDLALCHIAACLQRCLRPQDLAARHGGEEFVVLFDACAREEAIAATERIRATIELTPFKQATGQIGLTVSIGVATLNAHDRHIDDMLRRADQALYLAKSRGRNRVEIAV
jgi:diguanylate cyclase (GGDEF)-like protein